MTNERLTALDVARWNACLTHDPHDKNAAKNIEAYAAQQCAELQAENERLRKQLATIAKFCKERRTMGAGGCDNLSMERRQGKSEMARQVYLLTQPPTEGV